MNRVTIPGADHPSRAAAPTHTGVCFRQAIKADVAGILRVQAERYPEALQESARILRARLSAAGSTIWVAECDGSVIGYLFAYPEVLGRIASLDAVFTPSAKADALYLHDLAVSRAGSGRSVGRQLVGLAVKAAHRLQLSYLALVAVPGAAAYWRDFGFCTAEDEDWPAGLAIPDALRGYPPGTCYMVRAMKDRSE